MTPPPENSRVKIVLGCCLFCLVRLPAKFQTPRIIYSGRSSSGGVVCKVIIMSNPTRLRLGCGWVVVRFWQLWKTAYEIEEAALYIEATSLIEASSHIKADFLMSWKKIAKIEEHSGKMLARLKKFLKVFIKYLVSCISCCIYMKIKFSLKMLYVVTSISPILLKTKVCINILFHIHENKV